MIDASFYQNKRILITGHTGFKGSWLCAFLLSLGADVYGYALEPEHPSLFEECELENLLRESQKGKFNNLVQEDEPKTINNYIERAIADLQSETMLKVENNSIWKKAIEDRARELMILDSF